MKLFSCLSIIVFALLACVMFQVRGVTATQAHKESQANEYVLEVKGARGVQLDMLLITKPSPNAGPERETARIMAPYSRKFSAAKCYAWFDTLPNNGSGKVGDDYHIILRCNGRPTAEVEGHIKRDVHSTGGLGDL